MKNWDVNLSSYIVSIYDKITMRIVMKTEILIEATPKFVEIWDENENHFTFQTFIDFE